MLFLLAHGKGPVCRVPVFQHTAKVLAHGNLRVVVVVVVVAVALLLDFLLCSGSLPVLSEEGSAH